MSSINEQILIDYLDNTLQGDDRLKAAQVISEDEDAATTLAQLQFSVDLIREAGVVQQVAAIRQQYTTGASVVTMQKKQSGAIVRSFSKNVFRVAAMVVIVLGAASVYKYAATTNTSVYSQNFTSFDLETSRGANNDGQMETAYRNKNWNGVENIFGLQKDKSIKSWFLAGMAAMELKEYDRAVTYLNKVMTLNSSNADPVYQDEAEYYLALAYLGAKKTNEGVTILRKIRNNKEHVFYQKAAAIKAIDLELLEIKY